MIKVKIVQLLGTYDKWVVGKIENGSLKAEVIKREDDVIKLYRVKREDLIRFIRKYPYELQGHKVDMVLLVDLLTGVMYNGE